MKLATTTSDFAPYSQTLEQALELASQTPFRYLNFEFLRDTTDNEWEARIARCARIMREKGLSAVQAHAYSVNPYHPKRDPKSEIETVRRTLAACARLGIKDAVLHAVFCAQRPYPDGKEEFFETNRHFYTSLFPFMEEYGVNLLIENSAEQNSNGLYYFMTGAEMSEFLDWVGHPMLKAVWDTGHANMRAADQEREIRDLGRHLAAVHIHDNDGHADEHSAPFMGTTDFDAVMRGLLAVGFTGPFALECSSFPLPTGNFHAKRLQFGEARLAPTVELHRLAETYAYHAGKHILQAYGKFSE